MEILFSIWNQLIVGPMINILVLMYALFFANFGVSILVFTVAIRVVTFPLTLKQIRMTKKMSEIQPLAAEIRQKYPDDKQRQSQETMRLYKEKGVNPLGCLGPMFIQMPIWIGLYQAIIQTLPDHPERLASLSQKLYPWLPLVNEAIPLDSNFLWLDLAEPPRFILPVLVGISMWAVQKTSTVQPADPRQAQTTQMMLWLMPMMLMFFSFSLPSGLSLYWVASNVIQMGIQYFVAGWGNLLPTRRAGPSAQPSPAQPVKENAEDGNDDGSDGTVSRGSNRNRPRTARRRSRSGRNRRN